MSASHRDQELSLTAAAPFVGKSLAQTSRLAAAGTLGPVRRTTFGVFVTVGGIEDYTGIRIPDEKLAKAQRRPSLDTDKLWPGPVRVTIPKKITYSFDQVTSLIEAYVRQRDDAWRITLANFRNQDRA